MRIVCDSCGTKYSISDDKIKGKVFKIRCKKCSHVIIVRGNEPPEASAGASGAGASAAAANGAAAAVWYIVLGGQQDGPHSPEGLQAMLAQGALTPETYTWREGFTDWVPFSTIDELSHLMPAAAPAHNAHAEAALPASEDGGFGEDEATRVAAGMFDSQDSNHDPTAAMAAPAALFEPEATQAFSPDSFAASPSVAPASAAPASVTPEPAPEPAAPMAAVAPAAAPAAAAPLASFSAAAGAAAPAPMFGSASPEPAPSPMGGARNGNKSDMVGARSENSVLFSLNSLAQTEAAPAQAEQPTNTEASGLIDIRALSSSAAALSDARSGGAAGDVDPLAGPMAAGPAISVPAMMPMGTRKSNTPIFVAIGVCLFLILLIGGGLAAYYMTRDDTPQQVVMTKPDDVAAKADSKAGTGDDKKDEAKDDAKKDEEKKDEAVAKDDEKKDEAKDDEKKDEEVAATDEKKDDAKDDEGDAKKVAAVAREDKRTPAEIREARAKAKEDRERRLEERRERERERAAAKKTEKTPAKAKPSGNSNIDDILGDIGKTPKKAKTPAKTEKTPATPPPAAAAKLTRGQVNGVVRRYFGRVKGCAKGQSGTVTVRFTISPSGAVSGARVVTSQFAGTPAAGCIAGVVRSMKFPAASGSLTINYPFRL